MKKKLIFLPLLMVFSMTGCMSRIMDIFNRNSSGSNSGQNSSQTGSESGNTSSQGGGGGGNTSISLPPDVESYYSSISDSLSGSALTTALHSLNESKRTKTMGYGGHRNWFQYTEIVPGKTPSGKMVGFYNNDLVSSTWDNQATWNHEHVWPNSRGAGSGGSLSSPYIDADIHMVRPAPKSLNSERGNMFYGNGGSTYDAGQYVAAYRGVAARIIFYCAIADTRLTLVDKDTDGASNSTMGKLSTLLQWNIDYWPSSDSSADTALLVEQNRNNVIATKSGLQGNRNPFIDHPEYACKIWGNTNATTKSICGIS